MPDDDVRISVYELRTALTLILDEVEERLGPELDLAADHYWSLDAAASFDLDADPEVGAGQLTDDVDSVRRMLDRDLDEEVIVVWHDLDHVVGVLRRIVVLDTPG
jgi:hypothetical protein